MKFNKKLKSLLSIFCLIAVFVSAFAGCDSEITTDTTTEIVKTTTESQITENEAEDITAASQTEKTEEETDESETEKVNKPDSVGDDNSKAVLSEIPEYSGRPYAVINDNIPSFNKYELTVKGYETYASLDRLGRCGGAVASCGREIMPKDDEERGSISAVKPSGWVQAQYDCISGKYLYNRCHLIGWQLSAENANKRNLITGTRYMNTEGMLPFENMVDDYVEDTENHVMYRVTPIYNGLDYVAQGVLMEAYSVEDNGRGICFCIFAYNVQPGVTIDYFTGVNVANGEKLPDIDTSDDDRNENTGNEGDEDDNGGESSGEAADYVLNTNSKKYHLPDSSCVDKIKAENRENYHGTKEDLEDDGYVACKICKP